MKAATFTVIVSKYYQKEGYFLFTPHNINTQTTSI